MKRGLLVAGVVAGVMVLSLAGCGGPDDAPSGSGSVGDAPSSPSAPAANSAPAPAPAPAATSAPAAAAPLNCGQLAAAPVASAAVHLADYDASPVVLVGGKFTGSDGSTVVLQPACGIGDLNGDGAADGLGVVKINFGGTGQFWSLVAWTNSAGSPQLTASKALGDRNPVTDITVAGQRATVVYLTRTDDVPMAGVNIKRTAIYQLSGGSLTEVSHSDVSYTP
jgi:hypothetical protein